MTVANRLQRLQNAGVLRFRAVPNLAEFGLTTNIHGMVQADMQALERASSELIASPFVLRVWRVTGEYDLAFDGMFPSEEAIGSLVREIQTLDGVRRLVIHHSIETVYETTGWDALLTDPLPARESQVEFAPGAIIPPGMEQKVQIAATWVTALTAEDLDRLRQLSTPDIVFTIQPPHPAAGTFAGIVEVEKQAQRTHQAYKQLWYRIVSVQRTTGEWELVLDALSPVETQRGRVRTAFSRMAFAFRDGRVVRVASLGEMEVPEASGTLD
jgi:DNA-binding Lrp family transcriptional regulator/ketosteroid isomerase-like protein